MIRYKNLSIGGKILLVFLFFSLLSVSLLGLFSIQAGSKALEEESFNKLAAIREMKASQVEDYFRLIRNQVLTFSENQMIVDAMGAFSQSFQSLEEELQQPASQYSDANRAVKEYYKKEFLPVLQRNSHKALSLENYLPKDSTSQLLQYLYIANNNHVVGEKHFLNTPSDNSSYSAAHQKYHPLIRSYLEKFGYYDIFLVDIESGNIVYSVFKEVDYATSLLWGPYKNSNFAQAYKLARDATDSGFVGIADFKPYAPSYNKPAAFMASAVFNGGKKIGVAVFQMPVDRINNIMTNNQQWQKVGLGDSGETYIVGADFTLRNQSRFLIEDSENYFKMIEKAGKPESTIRKIRSLNNSIGLQSVKTIGTEAAQRGETGEAMFLDYRGVSVLSSYRPLDIEGVDWVLMSEIDESEAFRFIDYLQQQILFFLLATIVFVVIAALWFSKAITGPIVLLTHYAHKLSEHDFIHTAPFEYKGDLSSLGSRGDEIAELSTAFQHMHHELELSVDRLVESTVARERMQSELNIGHDIQMSMLPLIFPAFPEHEEFSVYADLTPARQVGGDFYDFFFIDDDSFCLCIGDVAGKGVPSALFMAVAKTLIKSRAMDDKSTASVIAHVNEELSVENKSFMFATIFLAILNVRTGKLLYTNAGHNPPYIIDVSGEIHRMNERHGLAVGIASDAQYSEQTATLKAGDKLFLFTDGVTEAMTPQGDFYGEPRLVNLLEEHAKNSVETIVKSVTTSVNQFEMGSGQSDDITLVALDFRGGDTRAFEITLDNRVEVFEEFSAQLEGFLQQQGSAFKVIQQLQVVFEDLLSNIIHYAYNDNDAHSIHIAMRIERDELKAVVIDDGIAFNLLEVDAPDITLALEKRNEGGLGIHLARNLVDTMRYDRIDNKNQISFTKKIT